MTEKETKKVKITFPGSGLIIECEPKTALYYHHIFASKSDADPAGLVKLTPENKVIEGGSSLPILDEEEARPSGPLPFAVRPKRGRPRKDNNDKQ